MVGQTISHYKVLAELGEGGMGVVYKAEDTKLRRVVALKFLRPEVLESEEHKARFLVEAQAAASLNHPNICTVYEIDEAEGQTFLAMAYVEGDTVSQKIKQRPLPLDEVLDIAIQAGEGLQAAHEKGIVHRDIKSSNLMLTPQGRVQVMDFGLARLSDRSRLTMTGSSLGTPAYMSPEQAKRRPADRQYCIPSSTKPTSRSRRCGWGCQPSWTASSPRRWQRDPRSATSTWTRCWWTCGRCARVRCRACGRQRRRGRVAEVSYWPRRDFSSLFSR
jgi:serine/threonine protein kinase